MKPSTILRPDYDREIPWPRDACRLIAQLRQELEYAYRKIHCGFKYGDFDLSVLRKSAEEAVTKMDEIDGPPF